MGYIYQQAEKLVKKYNTRCPYELLDAIGAITVFSDNYSEDGLKGFSTIINRQMFAFINAKLDEYSRKIVAGHEAAHLILHKNEIMLSPACALKDFSLYDNSGKLEFEANTFLANFLVSDGEIMEAIEDADGDYFVASKNLYTPPPLLAFKLYSMIRRGYDLKNPSSLNSKFLAQKN